MTKVDRVLGTVLSLLLLLSVTLGVHSAPISAQTFPFITLTEPVIFASELTFTITDPSRNIKPTLRDRITSDVPSLYGVIVEVDTLNGDREGISLLETGRNTGVFAPDLPAKRLPITFVGQDQPSEGNGILEFRTGRPGGGDTMEDVVMFYSNGAQVLQRVFELTLSDNRSLQVPSFAPQGTSFPMTISDSDLNDNSQSIETYSFTVKPFESEYDIMRNGKGVGASIEIEVNFWDAIENPLLPYPEYILTETGMNTGVFATNISLKDLDSDGSFFDQCDKIRFSYNDYFGDLSQESRDILIIGDAPKECSEILFSVPGSVNVGENMLITGAISPPHSAEVALEIGGASFPNVPAHFTVHSDSAGQFSMPFTPNREGTWFVEASWTGDADHFGDREGMTFTVQKASSLDFRVSLKPSSNSIVPGTTASSTATVKLLSGSPQPVTLSCSGIPSSQGKCKLNGSTTSIILTPTSKATLTVETGPTTKLGTYTAKITAASGSITKTAKFTVKVEMPKRVEIEVNQFSLKLANSVYFTFEVNMGDESAVTFTSPDPEHKIQAAKGGKFVGPAYVTSSNPMFPIRLSITAYGSNGAVLGLYNTQIQKISDLPLNFTNTDKAKIDFSGNVRLLEVAPLSIPQEPPTNDDYIDKQWYWFETNADEVVQEYMLDTFQLDPVIVAVIDTGVDYMHEDLRNNMWVNAAETPGDFLDNDGNGYIDDYYGIDCAIICVSGAIDPNGPADEHGHGSLIAGIINAEIDNGLGTAGIAPNAEIMAIRVSQNPDINFFGTEKTAAGVDYAVKMGAKVINLSVGSYVPSPFDQSLKDAIKRAVDKGVTIVASVGNDRTSNPIDPASYYNLIAVSSLSRFGPAEFGSEVVYFAYTHSNYGKYVDISAPGFYIFSTRPGDNYDYDAGTSFAAPQVAAAAAVIQGFVHQETGQYLSPMEVRSIILNSSSDLGPEGPDPYYGKGELNLLEILRYLKSKY